ncbi:SDR family oxidoreductase [Streptomyces sp. NPDC096132]|uniref:SDR family oxidoreductase n=1 Tax=Streptomyces sp. NPDC096132 TaxID=3366075 RepID=UPI00380DE94E
MANYIEGKVVVVTGAGGGFGRLTAEALIGMGAKVVGGDIDAEALKVFEEETAAGTGSFIGVPTDVTQRADVERLVRTAADTHGSVDVMINNAGTMPLAFFSDHVEAYTAWDRCIDINLKGVLNGITAVYDRMMTQGHGHVVNISSIYGNFPVLGAGVYGATKAAVNVMSESLRVEAQGKIKVTVVRPTGVVGTGIGSTMINPQAITGIGGQNTPRFFENYQKYVAGTLPPEMTDPGNTAYWTIDPRELAENVVYAINQPLGVSISEITVRATGENYIL